MESHKKKKEEFHRFQELPLEIRLMIFRLCIRKPACHTFIVAKDRNRDGWFPGLRADRGSGTGSLYRVWRNLSLTCHLARDALRAEMRAPKEIKVGQHGTFKAVIDTATDLVLLHLPYATKDRVTYCWSEHVPGPGSSMNIARARSLLSNITRLALRYKGQLPDGLSPGPFMCRCSTGHSKNFKYCPQELAGFLDLFRSLRNFYFVVPCGNAVTKDWFRRYKAKAKACHFMADAVHRDGALEIEQYHDYHKDYMRILPNPTRDHLMCKRADESNIWAGVDECLTQTRAIYKSLRGQEVFITPSDTRKAVWFGLLIEWNPWP